MSYISKLFSTGAVRQTPGKVMQTMLKAVGEGPYETIIEIGAGKGELTKALLESLSSFQHYHAFEVDEEACLHLKKTFPTIQVHQSSAFDFSEILSKNGKLNLFVSSIPLSFYPRKKIKDMLHEVKTRLAQGGKIVIIFSAVWLIPILKKELPGSTLSGFFTFPPYFILIHEL